MSIIGLLIAVLATCVIVYLDREGKLPPPIGWLLSVSKVLPSGTVTIEGNSAATAQRAIANLMATWAEYYASGGWGGPGVVLLVGWFSALAQAGGIA